MSFGDYVIAKSVTICGVLGEYYYFKPFTTQNGISKLIKYMRAIFFKFLGFVIVLEVILFFLWKPGLWSLVVLGPLMFIGIMDIRSKRHTIRRNFPILGNIRYLFEKIRPEIQQYFVETETEGTPINRMFRSVIYQRAKRVNDTRPFGTQLNVYKAGYEWVDHSVNAVPMEEINQDPRVLIGGKDCLKPYNASVLNISAMSYGSLSKNAVLALNKGAATGGFYHNTGEGSVSPYHLKHGGDLVWQIGTGYFGCRTKEGTFSAEKFKERAALETVKMIEVKISQGAKPGHGGILPAVKNTPEIAEIRGVDPYTTVASPPTHSAFKDAEGLMHFIKELRELSGGKPIGFKLCIGRKSEFIDYCKAMLATGIKPDYIAVDGGEGGTGAAPVEFTNSLGRPLRDGLSFVHNTLVGFDLRKEIKVVAAGKLFTAYHMVRAFALGADICNSARAMMMAIGCIQALECNRNSCPAGVATQDPVLSNGLDVEDKAKRTANFHKQTIHSLMDFLGAAGLRSPSDMKREYVNRRIDMSTIKNYEELYPSMKPGILLNEETTPSNYK